MKRWLQVGLAALSLMVALTPSWAQVQEIVFNLTPQAKFINCLGPGYGPPPKAVYDPAQQFVGRRGSRSKL